MARPVNKDLSPVQSIELSVSAIERAIHIKFFNGKNSFAICGVMINKGGSVAYTMELEIFFPSLINSQI